MARLPQMGGITTTAGSYTPSPSESQPGSAGLTLHSGLGTSPVNARSGAGNTGQPSAIRKGIWFKKTFKGVWGLGIPLAQGALPNAIPVSSCGNGSVKLSLILTT